MNETDTRRWICTYDIRLLDSGPIRHRVREWHTELNDVCAAFLHSKHDRYSVIW